MTRFQYDEKQDSDLKKILQLTEIGSEGGDSLLRKRKPPPPHTHVHDTFTLKTLLWPFRTEH